MKSGSVLLGLSILATMPLHASVVVAGASVESTSKTTTHSAEADEVRVIESRGYRIVLPSSRSFHTDEERSTPWGKATVRSEAARRSGITYIFSTYVFDGDRRIPAKQVAKTKDAFLKSHKCTATVLKIPPIKTADGNAWPQASFKGTCAAPGDYEILALVVDGRLYEFQVTNDPADQHSHHPLRPRARSFPPRICTKRSLGSSSAAGSRTHTTSRGDRHPSAQFSGSKAR